jgi:hypothetical protein
MVVSILSLELKMETLKMLNPTKNKNQIRDRKGRFTSVCSSDALGIVKSFKASQDENDVKNTIELLQAMGFSLYEIQVALFAKDQIYIDPLYKYELKEYKNSEAKALQPLTSVYFLGDCMFRPDWKIVDKLRKDRSGS